VYQGSGRKIDPKVIDYINRFVTGECHPQLTVLIDLDPQIGLERARGRELFDRMENQTLDFYERVRQGYLEIARREPDRVKVVDGNQSIAALQQQIWELIRHVL
jgi:dTMP kinase